MNFTQVYIYNYKCRGNEPREKNCLATLLITLDIMIDLDKYLRFPTDKAIPLALHAYMMYVDWSSDVLDVPTSLASHI